MGTLYDYCKEKNKEYLLQEWDYELNKDFDNYFGAKIVPY